MASKIFMTGFPGFIASRLVSELCRRDGEAGFTFLIQEHMRPAAERSIRELDERHPGLAKRSRLISGDIVDVTLGMGDQYDTVASEVTHVWHLAALYNLAAPAALSYRVNVIGTANLLDFCERADNLERLDYVSTCYVSGLRTGLVLERELDEDQEFKNHYESTKCWAEMEVRRRQHYLPVAIHRPAIVVGDSSTGVTDKYDGPYYLMRLLAKLPKWLPMVGVGDGTAPVNLVPVDFVTAAMAELSLNKESIGETVHLADPNPHSVHDVLETIAREFGFHRTIGAVPPLVLDRALDVEAVRNVLQIPREAIVYFNHDVSYDTANQRRLLSGTGVRCPDLMDILPTIVGYVRQYPDKPFLDGRML
jgi:nucleoside-diphosphate-sugar epimerase